MKEGKWILIDNVNLCSSSVLDRLNPLLEPDGYLVLNERGQVDGQTPEVCKSNPHMFSFLVLTLALGPTSSKLPNFFHYGSKEWNNFTCNEKSLY